jgi:deoxyhypusine monooxygenase
MRALFALHNIGCSDSVEALSAAFSSPSALLKHEIAYVMGQMKNPLAIPSLIN